MLEIILENYSDSSLCRSAISHSHESFPMISHHFSGGKVYGICSDFGCGAWALSTSLGGRGEHPHGTIRYNGNIINNKLLIKNSCFISEKIYPGINSRLYLHSAEYCINKALNHSNSQYTLCDIVRMFHLSPECLNRNLSYVYYYNIWFISMAIGFAAGKDIFCFPWLNIRDFGCFERMCSLGVVNQLKKSGKIILVPSNHVDRLKTVCDELLIIE